MLAPPTRKLLNTYRKPGTSPKAARRYTYSPPACGSKAPSSAKLNAPKMAMMPATIHAPSTRAGVPPAWAMTAALRKIPVPMVIPTTSEVAWTSVRPRRGSRGTELTWIVFQREPADRKTGRPVQYLHELQGPFFETGGRICSLSPHLPAGALRLPRTVVRTAAPGLG